MQILAKAQSAKELHYFCPVQEKYILSWYRDLMFLDEYHIINYFQEVLLKIIFSLNPAKMRQQHSTIVMSYALSCACAR